MEVPPRHRDALALLATMDAPDFGSLISAFDASTPTLQISSFAEAVASDLTPDSTVIEAMISALAGFNALIYSQGASAPELASQLSQSSDLELLDPEREVLADRLPVAALTRGIRLFRKSIDLAHEHQDIFLECRVLTDIRPVFLDDEVAMDAAMITHTLRLSHMDPTGRRGTFFVAVDDSNLRDIVQHIERATEKAESLQSLLVDNGLPFVGFEA